MADKIVNDRKSCHNCSNLEWVDGDLHDPSGWVCNKRDYKTIKEESAHHSKLDRDDYRLKGKKCCVKEFIGGDDD